MSSAASLPESGFGFNTNANKVPPPLPEEEQYHEPSLPPPRLPRRNSTVMDDNMYLEPTSARNAYASPEQAPSDYASLAGDHKIYQTSAMGATSGYAAPLQ